MKGTTRLVCGSLLAGLLSIGTLGCDDDDDDVVVITPAGSGFLTTEWTIDGAFDPEACAFYGAFDFELVVYDSFGNFFSETQVPCEAFVLSQQLPVDTYSADATLVDPADFAVSYTQVLVDLFITNGAELVVPIDFPARLMLPPATAQASTLEAGLEIE